MDDLDALARSGLKRAEVLAKNADDHLLAVGHDATVADRADAAQAWAMVALAATNLSPAPEEIAMAVEAEVRDEVGEAALRLQVVQEILERGARNGPRHPAIHAALEAIRTR